MSFGPAQQPACIEHSTFQTSYELLFSNDFWVGHSLSLAMLCGHVRFGWVVKLVGILYIWFGSQVPDRDRVRSQ
eukprot:3276672-Amphidinium_carterae.2